MKDARSPNAQDLASNTRNLEALRDAVVDAASIGTGLWLTYILVLLYLVVAAGEVTHRDLFLETPVKLPFLNVDLPLVGFFLFGPALLLVLHAYVLIHFVLLASKVGIFHTQLQAQIDDDDARTLLRRQLPSNIFVQVLAGPRDVRTGSLGTMMWLIAGISLVVAPVALLIFFQLQFLPYHSEAITWWQRIAVFADIVLLWTLWPSIARGKITRLSWRLMDLKAAASLIRLRQDLPLTAAGKQASSESLVSRRIFPRATLVISAIASVIVVLLVFTIATFPGEWLDGNLPPAQLVPWKFKRENPWGVDYWGLKSLHELLVAGELDPGARKASSLWSNRLMLPEIDVIDHVKFDTESKIASLPVTVSLRVRHLEGAILIGAKLRKVDFSGAWLQGAQIAQADLREAKFECGATNWKECAQLQGASLRSAQLQGASLVRAQLQGADFSSAQLQGAILLSAQLHGAIFLSAQLQGATLDSAGLQGAMLRNARLQGAVLSYAQLQGAELDNAKLQGASLDNAQLQGASFDGAQLEGASLKAVLAWRADALKADGKNAVRADTQTDANRACLQLNIYVDNECELVATSFDKLKQTILKEVPDGKSRRDAVTRIERLEPTSQFRGQDEISKDWANLKESSLAQPRYEEILAEQFRVTGCAFEGAPYVVRRFIGRFDTFGGKSPELPKLANAFLDEKNCPGSQGLSENEKVKLREISARATVHAP